MASPPIGSGVARCPLCGGRARLSLSSSGLAVMTLNCCKGQIFARGDESDRLLRACLVNEPAAAPSAPPPATAPADEPPPAPPPARRANVFDWLMGD